MQNTSNMTIEKIKDLLNARVLCGDDLLENEVFSACGSDMMSDVLAFVKNRAALLTGLVNPQVIRTAEMMDMKCVVFVRAKNPTSEMIELAKDSGIAVLATDMRMYESCGALYMAGLKGDGEKNE